MAKLQLEDGTTLTALAEVRSQLAPLGVNLDHWAIPEHPELRALLDKPALSDEEKEQVLGQLDPYFQKLKDEAGYQTRDLIVLHGGIPGLDDILAKFEKTHTHDDDEVRYIVDGEGVFGFVLEGGAQVRLTVNTGEYINVPKNTEHWFYMDPPKRIKAVRYFTSTEGWTPNYTGTEIRPIAS